MAAVSSLDRIFNEFAKDMVSGSWSGSVAHYRSDVVPTARFVERGILNGYAKFEHYFFDVK